MLLQPIVKYTLNCNFLMDYVDINLINYLLFFCIPGTVFFVFHDCIFMRV